MTAQESNRQVEQLMSEIDDLGRDIEQRGKVAARHLRSAASKLDATSARNGSALTGRYVVRVVKGDGGSASKAA